jgi:hypothetical protein
MEIEKISNSNSFGIERILAAAGISAGLGGAGVVWYFNPSNVNFLPVCPLYSLTGVACPGCGLTRGFHALFHGDVLTALDFNALLPFYALIFGYFFVSLGMVAVKGRGLSFKIFRPAFLYGFLALSLVFAVLRNLPIYPFNILYP